MTTSAGSSGGCPPDRGPPRPAAVGHFVCVEYPGLVENAEEMLRTLGGEKAVARTFRDPSLRLELKFRPDDPFAKPVFGERDPLVTSLLVRVRRKKRGPSRPEAEGGCRCGCHHHHPDRDKTEVVEVTPVATTYNFANMADFQFLPTVRVPSDDSGGGDRSAGVSHDFILDEAMFREDEGLPNLKWLEGEGRLFVLPSAFSRMDTLQDFPTRKDVINRATKGPTAGAPDGRSSPAVGPPDEDPKTSAEEQPFGPRRKDPLALGGRTRGKRMLYAQFIAFDTEKVPDGPQPQAVEQLGLKFISQADKDRMGRLFQEHPAWTRAALQTISGLPFFNVKCILPTVAYYIISGPFKNNWVKFGYDPRKHYEAAMYQTLDYRARVQGGGRLRISLKRPTTNYLLQNKVVSWPKPRTSTIAKESLQDVHQQPAAEEGVDGDMTEAVEDAARSEMYQYAFQEGVLPPGRQVHYQYRNILVEEAQELIRASLKGPDEQYDPKNGGWFEASLNSKLRSLLTRLVSETLKNGPRQVDKAAEENSKTELEEAADVPPDEDDDFDD